MSGIIGFNIGRSSGLKKVLPSGGNTPMFMVHRGADGCSGDGCSQNTSDNSYTKAYFNGERIDTDSCYDPSAYRWTPNKAGKYYVFAKLYLGEYQDRFIQGWTEFRINGNSYGYGQLRSYEGEFQSSGYSRDSHCNNIMGQLIDFNGSSDYVECWIKVNQSANYARLWGGSQSSDGSYWGGFFIG